MAHFAVIGSGGWGVAFACLLAGNKKNVAIWSRRPEFAQELRSARINHRQLPNIKIPDSVLITNDPNEIRSFANWIIAVPTAHLRSTISPLAKHLPNNLNVISLTKGIERDTFRRPSEIIQELLKPAKIAVLSGPNHAEEIAQKLPASAVVASDDSQFASWCQENLGTDRFRLYTNADYIGVELAGALKNVIGIAAGMCDGLGMGDNAKAALLTRGLVEMTRFAVAHGADMSSFVGLAGIGDLVATCFSPHGRNRSVGKRLAQGDSLNDIMNGPQIAEGIYTARSVHERAQAMKVDVPIMTAVYRVLYENRPVLAAMNDLLGRSLKGEGRW